METIYSWQRTLKQRSILALFILFIYLTLVSYILVVGDITFSLEGLGIALLISGILVGIQYYLSYHNPQLVVSSMFGGVPLEMSGARKLERIVEKMKIAYGIKNVETYVIPWRMINAFVVSSPEKHYLFVTEGAIEKLDEMELENVIAHEFAHMENEDSRYMTLAVIVAGLIVIISYYAMRMLFYRSSDRRGKEVFIIALIAIILYLIAPLITRIILSAISKDREYLADIRAVEITKYPPGMIRALYKVGKENTRDYIDREEYPTTFTALFFDYEDIETHPPIEDRIKRIAELTKTPLPPEVKAFIERRSKNNY